jgi:hypothetical protein
VDARSQSVNKIILGDMNYNCFRNTDDSFIQWMKSIGFQNKLDINEITTELGTQIDIVFSNYDLVLPGVYESVFSYHKPIFCELLNNEN